MIFVDFGVWSVDVSRLPARKGAAINDISVFSWVCSGGGLMVYKVWMLVLWAWHGWVWALWSLWSDALCDAVGCRLSSFVDVADCIEVSSIIVETSSECHGAAICGLA